MTQKYLSQLAAFLTFKKYNYAKDESPEVGSILKDNEGYFWLIGHYNECLNRKGDWDVEGIYEGYKFCEIASIKDIIKL